MRRVPRELLITALAMVLLSGCTWFGGSKASGNAQPVYDIKPGECFTAPGDVKTELATLNKVDCTRAHTQEAYAVIAYTKADGTKIGGAGAGATVSTYPGSDALTNFAQGNCASKFQTYVGINYLDSSLFFTYLLPSARGWQQDADRNVVCFVTTTGTTLTSSVQNTKK